MTQELAKTYSPAEIEPDVAGKWKQAGAFRGDPTAPVAKGRGPYCIVIPPPNVTAALHMGHALNNTLQDILIRWHRMLGDNTVWIPGTDHAGIATQTVVEKRVLAEQGKKRTDFQRDEFVAKIQAWKDEYEARITEQLMLMGCSCDWDRQRFTMDEVCARAVREAFFRLFKDGLIYRGKRLVNWDPATQTALADDEVEMREIDGHFWYMQYPLTPGGEPVVIDGQEVKHVTVATTRPETMLGDTAVAVNPNDPRAAALVGKMALLPIVNRPIPIIADDYVVLPDPDSDDPKAKFATGFLKVTPAHDPNDWEIGLRHDLPVINVMGPDGAISKDHRWPSDEWDQNKVNDFAHTLLGLDRYEARKAIVDWFDKNNRLEDKRPYRHSVGHSYRSHVPIEPYLSDQWYVKVTDDRLANAALRAMAQESPTTSRPPQADQGADSSRPPWEGKLRFTPERYAKTFRGWHENIRDWCISRQLWWGHRIPVWSSPGLPAETGPGEHSEFLSKIFEWANQERIVYQGAGRLVSGTEDTQSDPGSFICVKNADDEEVIRFLESHSYTRDPDVLDTWFSSALWPFSTLGWPDPRKFPDQFPEKEGDAALQTWNPGNVLCTAREIITLWVSRMVMFNLYFRGDLPFTDVFIHAMIQDGEGRKMSKSLGNGVDPLDIIASHGSDAMRYTLAAMTTQTQDVRLPVARDPETGHNTSDKFDLGRNFANKLWNATRFALSNLETKLPPEAEKHATDSSIGDWGLADKWILSRLAATVRDTNKALEQFEFSAYAQGLYDFFWRDLCDWYIEAIKPTVAQDPVQRRVLALCLDASLRMLHPVMPFITEKLWESLNNVAPIRELSGVSLFPSGLLVVASWPQVASGLIDPRTEKAFAEIQAVVGALRQVRTTHKTPPRQKVTFSAQAPAKLAQRLLEQSKLIETLANVETAEVGPHVDKPADAAATLVGDAQLFLHGLIDAETEQARLNKRLEEIAKSVAALKGRLSNKSYVDKAPAHLVQQTRDQLADVEKEADALRQQLAALK